MGDLAVILPVTLKFEGLWSNNKLDPGGATMEGITISTFRHYEPKATDQDLRNISSAEVLHIYDVGYFTPIGGASLSQGVAMVSFDYGVNSGVGAAKKVLSKTASVSGATRVRAISSSRLSFLEGLKTWKTFGKGWGSRVGQCEALAIKWEATSPVIAQAEIQVSVNEAKRKVQAHAAVIAGTTVTAAPTAIVPNKQLPLGGIIAIGAVLIVVVLVCGLFASLHSQRASALKAA